jgi:hypothetical protein
VKTKLLKGKKMGAVSEKSTRNDGDYTAKSRNVTALPRLSLLRPLWACKVTPEQYNFSHSELEK